MHAYLKVADRLSHPWQSKRSSNCALDVVTISSPTLLHCSVKFISPTQGDSLICMAIGSQPKQRSHAAGSETKHSRTRTNDLQGLYGRRQSSRWKTLAVGTRVKARFTAPEFKESVRPTLRFYPGHIVKTNVDGTYDIRWVRMRKGCCRILTDRVWESVCVDAAVWLVRG